MQILPSCIPEPVNSIIHSQGTNCDVVFSTDRGLCLIIKQLLVTGGVSDAVITSFCDKFRLAMVSVIEQLVQDGVDSHDIASVMKSINRDDTQLS